MHKADYAVAKYLSVRLSICLSHVGIVSKRLYIILNISSPSGSRTILVFPHQTGWQYSDGDPINGTTYRHRKLIGTYTRPTQQCHFE